MKQDIPQKIWLHWIVTPLMPSRANPENPFSIDAGLNWQPTAAAI
jgi:hypothetical protein